MLKFGTNFVYILAVLELDPFGVKAGILRSKLRREQLCGSNFAGIFAGSNFAGSNFARSNFARSNFARSNSLGSTLGATSREQLHGSNSTGVTT